MATSDLTTTTLMRNAPTAAVFRIGIQPLTPTQTLLSVHDRPALGPWTLLSPMGLRLLVGHPPRSTASQILKLIHERSRRRLLLHHRPLLHPLQLRPSRLLAVPLTLRIFHSARRGLSIQPRSYLALLSPQPRQPRFILLIPLILTRGTRQQALNTSRCPLAILPPDCRRSALPTRSPCRLSAYCIIQILPHIEPWPILCHLALKLPPTPLLHFRPSPPSPPNTRIICRSHRAIWRLVRTGNPGDSCGTPARQPRRSDLMRMRLVIASAHSTMACGPITTATPARTAGRRMFTGRRYSATGTKWHTSGPTGGWPPKYLRPSNEIDRRETMHTYSTVYTREVSRRLVVQLNL